MNSLRILFIGDVAGYLLKLNKMLLEKELESLVVLFPDPDNKNMEFLERTNLLDNSNYVINSEKGITSGKQLLKFIKEYNPDVVHSVFTFSILRTSFKVKKPWITHFFGTQLREKLYPFHSKILKMFYPLQRRKVYSVTTPDLLDLLKSKTYWIPHPIDTDFWKPMNIKLESDTIFFPHRFDDTKDVDELMKAWEVLREQNYTLKLLKWGDRWKEFQDRFGDKNVRYLDFMTKEELREEILKSALIWGNFKKGYAPQVDQECLSCGKIVLGAPLGEFKVDYDLPTIKCESYKDIIENTNSYINKKGDSEEYRQQIIDIHGTESIVNTLLQIYSEIM
jgi:glycosyltransferase involved in cell wall biosynthesis